MYLYMKIFFISVVLTSCIRANDISLKIDPGGHFGPILSLLISNNSEIVTASKDKSIKVWDLINGVEKREILGEIGSGNHGSIAVIALSQNKNYLVSGGVFPSENNKYNTIRVYDYKIGKLIKLLSSHSNLITDLKFSDDNKFLISSSRDMTVKIWDVEKDFKLIDTIVLTQPIVQAQIITKNSTKHLVIVDATGLIALYSLEKKSIIDGHNGSGRVNFTRSLANNQNDIAMSDKDQIYIFDMNTFNFKGRIRESGTSQIAYSPNGKYLVAGANKMPYACRVYDASNNYKLIAKFDSHDREITAIKFLDNDHVISTGGVNNTIYIWDINNTAKARKIEGLGSPITSTSVKKEKISFGSHYYTYAEKSTSEKEKISAQMTSILKIFMKNNIIDNHQLSDYQIDRLLSNINDDQYKVYLDHLTQNYNDFGPLERTINLTSLNVDSAIIDKRILNTSNNGFSLVPTENTLNRYFRLLYNSTLESYIGLNIYKDEIKSAEIKTDSTHDINAFGFYNEFILTADDSGYINIYNINGKLLFSFQGHEGHALSLSVDGEWLISGGTDQRIKIWNIENILNKITANETKLSSSLAKPMASIFVDKNNNSVIWIEEGYFTVSSPKALKYITWHMNRGYDKEAYRYDLSKFYDVFFRPDLVKLKLQGKDITPYTGGLTAQDALKNPPPSLKIIAVDDTNQHLIDSDKPMQVATKQEKIKVKFAIADEGGGVGSIRIYQEGKLIQTIGNNEITKVTANVDSKLAEKSFEESKKSSSLLALAKAVNKEELTFEDRVGRVDAQQLRNEAGTYEAEVSLKEGSNQISIEAFNSTNTITSYQASIDIKAEIPKKPSKLYAIVAGVNNFDASYIPTLKYAVGDAKAIADEMFKAKKTIYDDVEVIYLTDKEVTKESIYDAFKNVQKKASVNDTVVFYISTHGTSANGTFYLFPSNNADAGQFIDFSDLFKMSSSMKALSQVFIVDACQSGGAVDIASSVYDSRASVMARSAGIHLLSASTSGTSAFENEKVGHGVFTNEILASLKNPLNDTNKDGFVSIIEVSNNLIKRQQEEQNNAQMPVIRNVGSDIMIKKTN